MHLTLCPIVVGGDAPTLADGAGFDRDDVRRLRLLASEVEGDEVFLHYEVDARRPRHEQEEDLDPPRASRRRRRRSPA